MEKILPSSELYSHPSVLLEDHLTTVSKLADMFLSEKPEKIKEDLSAVVKIITLSHDIGKSTNYFQQYLFSPEDEKEKLKTEETNHSLFSAVCAYYLVKEKCDNDIFSLFAYISVRRHHGNLIDISDEVSIFDDTNKKVLYKQIDKIDENKFSILANKLLNAGLSFSLNKTAISKWVENFDKEILRFRRILRHLDSDIKNHIKLSLIYSLLLDADKSAAVIKDTSILNRKCLDDTNWVINYINTAKFPFSPLNDMRKMAFYEVMNARINIDQKIYSLNLPTGLGKTFISLSFALRLKNKLKEFGIIPRIIYALPFLSIIEQNAQVFEKIIKANGICPDSDILLKHHHLSEVYFRVREDEYESDEAKILVEGWNSEIIVTTFAQLFHTLVSNRNRNIRKFHKLANSIIILDEVQSVPTKYWLLIKKLLNQLSETMNTYIIFSTATEPLIFGRGETVKLVKNDSYFNSLDRVSLISEIDKTITIEDLYERKSDQDKATLYILNTISAAKKFYNLIKSDSESKTYLSTHIIPKERLKRIEEIRKGKYKIVVSTQLVEAGVDVDFDIVIRDLAPLDCINQSAGRCNRNDKRKGIVKVVKIKDSVGKSYASYIYDPVLLDITEKLLSHTRETKEKEFLWLINQYYSLTQERITQQASREILEAVSKLRYDRDISDEKRVSVSDFSLIDYDYPKKDVFIEIDEEAKKIWNEFQQLKNIKDRFSRKKVFDKIKSDFYNYIISIPANAPNMPPCIGEICYVQQSLLEDYYDRETGFIVKDERSIVIY